VEQAMVVEIAEGRTAGAGIPRVSTPGATTAAGRTLQAMSMPEERTLATKIIYMSP
jgi:hypothetical protein